MNWRGFAKIELHRHLEGSIRLETIVDVAEEAEVKLPSQNLEDLKDQVLVLNPMKDLAEALNKFLLAQSILATPEILERVAYENCIDAFKDGIRILELRYSPGYINLNHPKLNYDNIHKSILKGIANAEKELKGELIVGLIAIISRDQAEDEAAKTTEFAIRNREHFVGFDLAGDELVHATSRFKSYFKRAKDAGLGITAHSGEVNVDHAASFIKASVEELGATRIGHGVQVHRDREMIDFVKKNGIVLELCPTSNVLTSAVPNLKAHPIKRLLENDLKVTLNSDDPHLFGIDLTHEYEILSSELCMTEAQFRKMNQTAFQASFIPNFKLQKHRHLFF